MNAIAIDDEKWLLRNFSSESAGIEGLTLVGSFQRAQEAVSYAEESPVDIAFVDIRMPKTDGFEAARMLRSANPDIIIVFVSAHEKSEVANREQLPRSYFLSKPYSHDDIKALFNTIQHEKSTL